MKERRKVVITGMGVVTAAGIGVDAFKKSLIEGISGIRTIDLFDTTDYPVHIAGQLPSHFELSSRYKVGAGAGTNGMLGRLGRVALAAAGEAWVSRGEPKRRTKPSGCIIASGSGSILNTERYIFGEYNGKPGFHPELPEDILKTVIPCDYVPTYVVSACSSGAVAIALAADRIRTGAWDVALAGGADVLSRLCFGGFNVLRAMDPEPCRPFDVSRAGMTLGEGAGFIVLEALDHAWGRDVTIHAELLGYAIGMDAYHVTTPDVTGIAWSQVIRKAIRDAGIKPSDIDYINAHGTATPLNDEAEAAAIRNVFKLHVNDLPVSSIKPITGHCQFAAGAVEAVAAVLSVRDGFIPPTLNTTRVDPSLSIDVACGIGIRRTLDHVMTQSFGFGGTSCVLIFRRWEDEYD